VPNTPKAARSTARLPSTSLRLQIQAERMFASPPRCDQSRPKDAAFATSAAIPTVPIVKALGSVPCAACHKAMPITQSPNTPIVAALASAAVGLERSGASRQTCSDLDSEHDGVDG